MLGAEPGIVDLASENKRKLSWYKDKWTHHGFLADGLEERVLADLNKIKPDILYVGMGVPGRRSFWTNT